MLERRHAIVGGIAVAAVASVCAPASGVVAYGPVFFHEGFEHPRDTVGQIAVEAEADLEWVTMNPGTDTAGHFVQAAGNSNTVFGDPGGTRHGDLNNYRGGTAYGNYGSPGFHYYGYANDPAAAQGFVEREDLYVDPAAWVEGANAGVPLFWIQQTIAASYSAIMTYEPVRTSEGAIDFQSPDGGSAGLITTAGWYTLETAYVPNAGTIDVLGTMYDAAGNTVGTTPLKHTSVPSWYLAYGPGYDWNVYWNNGALGDHLQMDNITVQALVPEPASAALLSLAGLAGLWPRRTRRSR